MVVAALPTAPPDEESALRARRTRSGRAARHRRSAPLAVTRHGDIVLVRAIRDGAAALVAPLERACATPATRALGLAVGVSTVQRGLSTVGDAYREASLAVRRVAATGAACCRLPTSRRSTTSRSATTRSPGA